MLGYLEDGNIRPPEPGTVPTGDIGTVDADGWLTVVDRKKLVIIRGGANVYPLEVERVIATHPGVPKVAVYPVPDDRLVSPRSSKVPQKNRISTRSPRCAEVNSPRTRSPRSGAGSTACPSTPWARSSAPGCANSSTHTGGPRRTGRDTLLVHRSTPEPEERPVALNSEIVTRMFGLEGRVAIVTGASSGLGATVAETLAGLGAEVAVVARRKDRLEELAERIGGFAVAADLTDLDAIGQVVPAVAEKLGPPEILVNAAGSMFTEERAESEPLDAMRRTLDLNLLAPFRLAQDVFPHMRAAGRGSIVNVSSISGRVGVPGIPQASYAASKLGLSGLTAELAVQWARHSIRVNTVAPGFFRSEITGPLYDSERASEYLRRNTPLPKDGTADDIVGAIVWLRRAHRYPHQHRVARW